MPMSSSPTTRWKAAPITVAQISGGQALIDSGLSAGEQVVVDGQYAAAAGQPCDDPARQGGAGGGEPERAASGHPVNISAPFIARPIATALLMVGLLLCGLATYRLLPVAALPNVNFPTIQVTAQLPGADPQTMAASVASPLEQQFGEIPGVTQMTSSSTLGYHADSRSNSISAAMSTAPRRDVLAAINAAERAAAAQHDVSADDPEGQSGGHADPGARPSPPTPLPLTTVDAYAENILLQKISQIPGVGLGRHRRPAEAGHPRRRSTRKRLPRAASASRPCAPCSARPMSISQRARSTVRARPIRSTPTTS